MNLKDQISRRGCHCQRAALGTRGEGTAGGGCRAQLLVLLLPLMWRTGASLQVRGGFLLAKQMKAPPLLAEAFSTPERRRAGQQQPVPFTTPYTQPSTPGCQWGSALHWCVLWGAFASSGTQSVSNYSRCNADVTGQGNDTIGRACWEQPR